MNYEAIQSQITRARIERSVVLSEYVAEAIVEAWHAARCVAADLRAVVEGTTNYLPRSQA
jgi:hypothetical protein